MKLKKNETNTPKNYVSNNQECKKEVHKGTYCEK